MDYTPILAKNFDVSKIRYGPVKKTSVAKSVYINYGGDKCVIQLPAMHVPYGMNDSSMFKDKKDPSSKIPNYSMNISFKGLDENKGIGKAFDMFTKIEEKIKSDVYANRVTWLNDRYDDMESVVSRLFSSNIQLDRDKETKKPLNRYPPTFRVKVPSVSEIEEDGTVSTMFKFDASDMENNVIEFQNIINNIKGAKAQLIVQLMGLWFAGGKYGCTWKILSGRFQVAKSAKYTYVPDSDDEQPSKPSNENEDEDDEDEIAPDIDVSSPATAPTPVTRVPVSDAEDEDEGEAEGEGEEEEEEEAPPPPPPKKVTAKKTVAKK